MFFNFINLSIIVVCIIHLILAIIFFRNWKNKIHFWFSFLILSLIGWCVTMMFYRYFPTKDGTILWAILLYESAIFIPFSFLHFALVFPKKLAYATNWYLRILIFLPAMALVFITAIPSKVIKDVIFQPGLEKVLIWGQYYLLYVLYILGYFTLAFIILFKKYLKSKGLEKLQMRFIIFGALPSSLIGSFTNLVLPTFGIFHFNWLGQITSLIFVIFIFYAVIKHHLMNIRIIAIEMFAGFLVLMVLFNVFIPIIFQHWLIRLILFAFVFIFSFLLIRGILKIEKMNAHLRKLLEMRSEFLDVASHQLRTPVSVINGLISMLKEGVIGGEDKQETKKFINDIYIKGKKLEQIINDILAASEVDSEDFEISRSIKQPTQIEEIIEKVVNDFKSEAEKKNLILTFEKPDNLLPKIILAFSDIEQAITNLVNNAIIYTTKGFVKIKASKENNNVVVKIIDSGIGIPKEDLLSLFDKFVRASNANRVYTDGSGLGLFIVKKIIEAHDGTVEVESLEGKGTTFIIRLPIAM